MNTQPDSMTRFLQRMSPLVETLTHQSDARMLWGRLSSGQPIPARIVALDRVPTQLIETLVRTLTGASPVVTSFTPGDCDGAFSMTLVVFAADRPIDHRDAEVYEALKKVVPDSSLLGVFAGAERLVDAKDAANLDRNIGRMLIADNRLNLQTIDPAQHAHFLLAPAPDTGPLAQRLNRDHALLAQAIQLVSSDSEAIKLRAVTSVYVTARRAVIDSIETPALTDPGAISREGELADDRRSAMAAIDDARARAQRVLLVRTAIHEADVRGIIGLWARSQESVSTLEGALSLAAGQFNRAIDQELGRIAGSLESSIRRQMGAFDTPDRSQTNGSPRVPLLPQSTLQAPDMEPTAHVRHPEAHKSSPLRAGAVSGAGVAAAAAICTSLSPLAVGGLFVAAFVGPVIAGMCGQTPGRTTYRDQLIAQGRLRAAEHQRAFSGELNDFFDDVRTWVAHHAGRPPAGAVDQSARVDTRPDDGPRHCVEQCDQLASELGVHFR